MGKKVVIRILALGLMLALAPLAGTLAQVAPQTGPFTINPVVKRGDPRMDGGTFFDCDDCDVIIGGERSLNDLGQVVIFGFVGNCPGGVYVVSSRSGFPVADVCHPTPFGRLSLFAGANINNQGQVVLNMGPTINNRIVDMVLLYADGPLNKVAAEGEQSPTGTIFGGSCGFGRPSLNNHGEVAFFACSDMDSQGRIFNGVYATSGGVLRKVLKSGDPSPLGGVLSLAFGNSQPVHINDKGEVLFRAGQLDEDINAPERFGLFLATAEGIKKVELSKDTMPNGSKAADNSIGGGTLNNKGEVVFGLRLAGKPAVGYFLYSGGQTSTLILDRQATPIGGTFDLTQDVEDPFGPKINDNGTVAVMANVADGNSPEAIFLVSPKAVLKVVGIGDRLPTSEKIRSLNSFALNNLGQVAFLANASTSSLKPRPLGVYLATPVAPTITSIKLKHKKGGLELRVNGAAMIAGDTVIELNGVPLEAMNYPSDFHEDGGTTTRVVSRDARLEQFLQAGQTAQITVVNSLTNLHSAPKAFTR